jgi:hypothetical protein
LLIEKSSRSLAASDVEAAYRRCRTRRAPLWSTLADACGLDTRQMRETVLQHTVEALNDLTESDCALRFSQQHKPSDNATFRFSFPELFGRMFPQGGAESRRHAELVLDAVISSKGSGLAFLRGGSSLPLAMHGAANLRLTELPELAAWARSALEVGAAACDGQASLIVNSAFGDSVLLWQEQDGVFLAFCRERSELAYCLAMLDARRWDAAEPRRRSAR